MKGMMMRDLMRDIVQIGFSALRTILIAACVSAASVVQAHQGDIRYVIRSLGTLGGAASSAQDINTAGQVVGWSNVKSGESHAFLYSDDELLNLGTLVGGTTSHAMAINDHGQVVGYSGINRYGPSFPEIIQAFVWERGVMHATDALYCPCTFNRRYGTSRAYAINTYGEVVGESETIRGSWVLHAFMLNGDTMHDVGAGPGAWEISRAFSVNNHGHVVGEFEPRPDCSQSATRGAFLWHNGVRQDLGTLSGHSSSAALDINETGQVVGWSGTFDGSVSKSFIWSDGVMRDIGILPGDSNSAALGINNAGEVVGWSGTSDRSVSRAFLWLDGRMIDLNTLLTNGAGWVLTEAKAINSKRQIVGTGIYNGQTRAFLLTPLDEVDSPARLNTGDVRESAKRRQAKYFVHRPLSPAVLLVKEYSESGSVRVLRIEFHK